MQIHKSVHVCYREYRADYVSKAESTSPSSGRRRYRSYICWPPAGHADGAASQTALFAQQEKHCMRLYFIILYSSFITNAHMYLYLIVDMPYAVTCLVLYYEELHSMQESVNQPQPQ